MNPHSPPTKHKLNFVEKAIQYLQKEETLKQIHHYVMDPLLNHILDRVFPYIVFTCVLFTIILIVVMCTFALLLLQFRNTASVVSPQVSLSQ
jgi:hypothetical protein